MLTHLHIVDLAIIEEVEFSPGPGLNVLTGETGAGKSIIVGAAGLLRGGRMSAEMVRSGCKEAVVEALFDLSDSPEVAGILEQAGLPLEGEELLVRRVLSSAGRGRVHVNGALCTLSVLGKIMSRLLDISGQHEYQLLSDRRIQQQILDAVGVPPKDLERVGQAHARLKELAGILASTQMDDQQRSERLDFLRYQLQELEQAALSPDEDLDLEKEQARLRRAADLIEVATDGEQELYNADQAVAGRTAQVQRRLESLAHVDSSLGDLAAQLEEARLLVEDVALSLRQYASGVSLDPARLHQVEERLDLIHRLKRKHGRSVAEILKRQQSMSQELEEISSAEQRLDELESQLASARKEAEEAASQLTNARRAAGVKLSRRVSRHLGGLRMKGAKLKVEVTPRQERKGDDPALCWGGRRLGPTGWDGVEFLMAANPGEQARSLARIASGGELSRVMLALRRVLGKHDPVSTSIFDEVDAGIGGAVADVVGQYLAQVASHRQVLCVTHLPQVAAHAHQHFHVGKTTGRRRTRCTLRRLPAKDRAEELARMLGGERITAQARANARQLLEAAEKGRK